PMLPFAPHPPPPPSFPTRRSSDLPLKHHAPAHNGQHHPRPRDLLRRTRQILPIDHDAIAELADLQRAFVFLLVVQVGVVDRVEADRKSTRLNSSHQIISYAVFCLK